MELPSRETVGRLFARCLGLGMALLGAVLVLDGSTGAGASTLFVGGGVTVWPAVLTGSLKRVVEFFGLLLELG